MLTIVPRVNSGLELNLEATKEIGYRKIFSAIVISKFNIPKMIKLILGNISWECRKKTRFEVKKIHRN